MVCEHEPISGDLTVNEHDPVMFCVDAGSNVVDAIQS